MHGTDGSIFARNVMTQNPVGEVELVTAEGRQSVPFDGADLYVTGVGAFLRAVAGQGRPAADGADGVKSLAVAEAVKRAAETGQRVMVDYKGI